MGLGALMRLLAVAMVAVAVAWPAPAVSGQVIPAGALSCPTSLVSSFTPCLNFIINSTASPTADCCRSLGELMKASSGCACLILTGSVPLGVPVNRTMAVTLPRACNNASVPLQCLDPTTSAQSPAPGPIADAPAPSMAPSLAPLPPVTQAPVATPEPDTPAAAAPPVVEPTATAPVSQGQTRPTVVPSAAWRASAHVSVGPAAVVLLLAVAGAAMV